MSDTVRIMIGTEAREVSREDARRIAIASIGSEIRALDERRAALVRVQGLLQSADYALPPMPIEHADRTPPRASRREPDQTGGDTT